MPVRSDIKMGDWVVPLTIDISPAIYASGDLLADVVEVPFACQANGASMLHSAIVTDFSDQAGAMHLEFFRANPGSLGTINLPMAITDTQAALGCGHVAIAATDYSDLGAQQMATKTSVGLEMMPADAGTSLWMAIKSMDTKTYAKPYLSVKLGFLRG